MTELGARGRLEFPAILWKALVAMLCAALSLLTSVALSAAPPPAAELRPVMIDWSAVSEGTVGRCGLGLLHSLLLQGLLESGFAVVDAVSPGVIVVTLHEVKGAILVEAERDDIMATRRVPVPGRCDSTLGVDLQAAARATARQVDAEARARQALASGIVDNALPTPNPAWANDRPTPFEVERVDAAPRYERGPAGVLARVGLGAGMSRADFPFAAASIQLGTRLGEWTVAGSFDAGLRVSEGVTVFEPALGPEVGRRLRAGGFELGVAAGVQLLGHTYWRDDGRGGHLDVRFSVPVRLEHVGTGIGVELVPAARLRPVEHTVGETVAYKIGHLGGVVALTFRVPP